MNDVDLCYLAGHKALEMFRAGALSPVDIVQAQAMRTKRSGRTVNAFTDTFFDEALVQAHDAEAAYRAGRARPLEGLTLAVKDHQDIAGKRTTHACIGHMHDVAAGTHPACQRLLDAGAIVTAKTTTPEFCLAGVTYSKLFGVTGTPWNPHYTAGGSSGGAGAALAAGLVTLATGSDIAGSIRVPAACCGVVGYKPPYGRIPGVSPLNLEPYCVTGPMARSVPDCALMANVMSGFHIEDPASIRQEIDLVAAADWSERPRIAISYDLGFSVIAPEVRAMLEQAVARLRDHDAVVEDVGLCWSGQVVRDGAAYLDLLFDPMLKDVVQQHGETLCDYTIYYAEKAAQARPAALMQGLEAASAMSAELAPILERFDALICPTVATHEVPADAGPWNSVTVDGVDVDTDFGWVLTLPFNMLGRLPVLAVPIGLSASGLPAGLQVVTRSYDDLRAFRVGSLIESLCPTFARTEYRPQMHETGSQ